VTLLVFHYECIKENRGVSLIALISECLSSTSSLPDDPRGIQFLPFLFTYLRKRQFHFIQGVVDRRHCHMVCAVPWKYSKSGALKMWSPTSADTDFSGAEEDAGELLTNRYGKSTTHQSPSDFRYRSIITVATNYLEALEGEGDFDCSCVVLLLRCDSL
jgi:hypothetical protein